MFHPCPKLCPGFSTAHVHQILHTMLLAMRSHDQPLACLSHPPLTIQLLCPPFWPKKGSKSLLPSETLNWLFPLPGISLAQLLKLWAHSCLLELQGYIFTMAFLDIVIKQEHTFSIIGPHLFPSLHLPRSSLILFIH